MKSLTIGLSTISPDFQVEERCIADGEFSKMTNSRDTRPLGGKYSATLGMISAGRSSRVFCAGLIDKSRLVQNAFKKVLLTYREKYFPLGDLTILWFRGGPNWH